MPIQQPSLKGIPIISIWSGHGDSDPGALAPDGRQERDDVKKIAQKVYNKLKAKGVNVELEGRERDLGSTISDINAKYKNWDDAWIVEIHRDWANPNWNARQKEDQMGVYFYKDSDDSQAIADQMITSMIADGAYSDGEVRDFQGSWSQDHYLDWAGYHLGFIHRTNPMAHIIECGAMNGKADDATFERYADMIAKAMYEAYTGKSYGATSATVVNDKKIAAIAKFKASGDVTVNTATELYTITNAGAFVKTGKVIPAGTVFKGAFSSGDWFMSGYSHSTKAGNVFKNPALPKPAPVATPTPDPKPATVVPNADQLQIKTLESEIKMLKAAQATNVTENKSLKLEIEAKDRELTELRHSNKKMGEVVDQTKAELATAISSVKKSNQDWAALELEVAEMKAAEMEVIESKPKKFDLNILAIDFARYGVILGVVWQAVGEFAVQTGMQDDKWFVNVATLITVGGSYLREIIAKINATNNIKPD